MVFWGNVWLNVFSVIVATLIFIVVLFKRRYAYWKNLGVAYLEPTIPFGNVKNHMLQKQSSSEFFKEIYSTMKARKVIHAGSYMFYARMYMPIDLDLIKRIMQVDFTYFASHGSYANEKDDPLSAHLGSLNGQKWRTLRVKLSPTFTSGKMKNMFPIMVTISQELISVLEEDCQSGGPVEVKDISARFNTDVVGSCAFGIDCNSLKDPETQFRKQGKRLLQLKPWEMMSNLFSFVLPNLSRSLGLRHFPKEPADFFLNVITETVNYREQNDVSRNDLLQLLMDIKNKDDKESDTTITLKELAAQAFGFFLGGYETSSTLMSFALIELAINEDIQNTLRDEINTVLKGNSDNFTYDTLAELRYLDMVIHETLRKHPPLPMIPRVCTKDYKVPNTEVIIPEGMPVLIPVSGIHHDHEFYPDPEKFDPMRFSNENKSTRHQFAFIPFGEGPRICLGNVAVYVLGVIIATAIIVPVFFKRRYAYWRNVGVPYLEPTIPFGNMKEHITQKKSSLEYFKEFYSAMRARKVIHAGSYILYARAYVPIDLDLIKHIMQVDSGHFIHRGGYVNEKDDALSAQLFSLEHQKWKNLRAKLSTIFLSGKSNIFSINVKISEELIEILQEELQNYGPVEAKDISARFITDVIGICAFGIDCNSLKDPESEFRIQSKRLLNLTPGEMFSSSFSFVFPNLSRSLRVSLLPKGLTNFFTKVVRETVTYREQNNIIKNDLMQLLLELKNKQNPNSDVTITFNELAAEAFAFFFAGFETSSTLMSFALIELAINEDVQNTLRHKISTVLEGNSFTKNSLEELRYVDMVMHETLRKYPPVPIITKMCTKDYRVPNTEIVIPEGMTAIIPVSGVHYDLEYYPNPEKFDPTRFSYENRSKRRQCDYLPFGEGPRSCLGTLAGLGSIIKTLFV